MEKRLLEIRRKAKARKPNFVRQEQPKRKKLNPGWRRPRGIHSKARRAWRGKKRWPAQGFRSPAAVRGLTREGFVPVMVSNVSDLKNIGESQAAVISGKVGQKKRAQIVKRADELGIKIANIKDVQSYLKSVSEDMQERKAEKQETTKEKEKRTAEKEKKAQEKKKEDLAEKLTEEEKKEREKKERDKALIAKGN